MVVYVDVVAYDEAIQMTTQKGACGWLYTREVPLGHLSMYSDPLSH